MSTGAWLNKLLSSQVRDGYIVIKSLKIMYLLTKRSQDLVNKQVIKIMYSEKKST